MKRRAFLGSIGKSSIVLLGFPGLSFNGQEIISEFSVETVTKGPRHHFFGYYGINPWNKSQKFMLGIEAGSQDHLPEKGGKAAIGLIDTRNRKFERVADTAAWNFQQGAMLHWNPINPDTEFYFNDNLDGDIVSRKINISSGKETVIPRAINALSHNGKYALSLNYGRLGRLRKVVGYSGVKDPNPNDPHPKNDGVYLTDMKTGKAKLIVSVFEVYEMLKKRGLDLKAAHMWFNHVVFNKSDTRFFFLARTRKAGGNLETGMFTANIDGSDLFEAIPYGSGVSHFDWRNNKEIIATFQNIGDNGNKHYLLKDKEQDFRLIGEGRLSFDGHCVFGPDQTWLATDRKYKSELRQQLYIYNVETKQFIKLAVHEMKEKRFISGDLRCDFHPRWNHTGDKICFDSLDQTDWTRQIHIINLNLK